MWKDRKRPAEPLYRIVYCSRLDHAASERSTDDHIAAIIEQSRAWNPQAGITGVLITNRRIFTQVLEGPVHAVKSLIGHIICDPRHQDVRLVSKHGVAERMFHEWSMALIVSGSVEDETLFFPASDHPSDIAAISAFCATVRQHVLKA